MRKNIFTDVPQEQARQFCIDDFYESLRLAISNAGGGQSVIGSNPGKVTVEELANVLSQNGVRFVYDRNRSITNVKSKMDFYIDTDNNRNQTL